MKKIMVIATPTEWEEIGAFIRKLSSWRSFAKNCTLSAVNVVQTPKHYFDDRLKLFEQIYGNKADTNAVLGLDTQGRFRTKIVLSEEDATLLRVFYTDHTEMVAE